MNLQGKTVLVLGMGETGLSMVKWLSRQGAHIRVADSRMEPPGWKEIMETFPSAQVHRGHFEPEIFEDV
ncbi:MAG TPA: NAD(P)-dependent oxidoreductase, partial [Nitrosomonas sp.]|nr:NAD(P)-dependent oxidoreductase [Nitrosomonas sp.]